jgi:hypothetical protein
MSEYSDNYNQMNYPTVFPCYNEVKEILKTIMGDTWKPIIGQPDFMYEKTETYEREETIHGVTYQRRIFLARQRKSGDVKVSFTVKMNDNIVTTAIYNIPNINNGDCINLFAKCAETQIGIFEVLNAMEVRDDTKTEKKAAEERKRSR